MSMTMRAVSIGGLLAGAVLIGGATTPAAAVDALGVVGAVGNFVGAATGAPTPLVDERLGALAGHAGKGAGGKLGGAGAKHGGSGSHHHK